MRIRSAVSVALLVVAGFSLIVAPAGSGLTVVPWQLYLPSHVPQGEPFTITVSGPSDTSFVLEVRPATNTTPIFDQPFVLPANSSSPQSYLPVSIQLSNLSLGDYNAIVLTGPDLTTDATNGTFAVVTPYNLTTIYQNVTSMQETIYSLSYQNQQLGYSLSTLQTSFNALIGLFVFSICFMLSFGPLVIFAKKTKIRFRRWYGRTMTERPYLSHMVERDERESGTLISTSRIWHATCCKVGMGMYYSVPGAKFHCKAAHGITAARVGSDVVLAEDAVFRIRAAGKEPVGIPLGYSTTPVGPYHVSLSDLAGGI